MEASKVEKIMARLDRERLLGGVPPVEEEEVEAGRHVAAFVYHAMQLGGLRVQDASLALVCRARGGKVEQLRYAVENADTNDLMLRGEIAQKGLRPVGVIIAIPDRERPVSKGPNSPRQIPLLFHAEVFDGCEESLSLIRRCFAVFEKQYKSGGSRSN
jgi:hypothetical protein